MSSTAIRSLGLLRIIQNNRGLTRTVQHPLRLSVNCQPRLVQGLEPNFSFVRGLTNQTLRKLPGDYPPVTRSDHWERKIRGAFKHMDVDADGYLTSEDYMAIGKRIAEYMNLDDERTEGVLDKCRHNWAAVGGNKNKVSEEEYLQNIHSLTIQSRTQPELYNSTVSAEFKLMDIDDDGFVSKEEHAAFFHGIRVPSQYSKGIFDDMDTDKDGIISFEEFAEGHLEFWLTENPNNKYNTFYGPEFIKQWK